MYDELYSCLTHYRSLEDADEQEIYANVQRITGKVKKHLDLAFKLDNLIFSELLLVHMGPQTI